MLVYNKRRLRLNNAQRHIEEYNKKNGWGISKENLEETITECGKRLNKKEISRHRWWTTYLYIVELDGMIIGYIDAETTGDDSAHDKGYEDGVCDIHEMKAVEKMVIVYEDAE